MRLLTVAALLMGLSGSLWPAQPALANHGMVDFGGCGTKEVHVEQDMTKGRTDSLLVSVDFAVGCKHLIYTNVAAAGRGEMQGNDGQEARCVRDGQMDAANIFNYAWHETVNPTSIPVRCTSYTGPD